MATAAGATLSKVLDAASYAKSLIFLTWHGATPFLWATCYEHTLKHATTTRQPPGILFGRMHTWRTSVIPIRWLLPPLLQNWPHTTTTLQNTVYRRIASKDPLKCYGIPTPPSLKQLINLVHFEADGSKMKSPKRAAFLQVSPPQMVDALAKDLDASDAMCLYSSVQCRRFIPYGYISPENWELINKKFRTMPNLLVWYAVWASMNCLLSFEWKIEFLLHFASKLCVKHSTYELW